MTQLSPTISRLVFSSFLLALPGCEGRQREQVEVPAYEDCENLNPIHCLLPFPSDRFLRKDPITITGLRVAFGATTMPWSATGVMPSPDAFSRGDGFSPGTRIMTSFGRPVDLANVAGKESIGRSLEDDSPTMIIDLATGERIPHWIENDAEPDSPDTSVLFVNTARLLEVDSSYAVVLRNLVGEDGKALPPTNAFRALRDGLQTTKPVPDLEERRDSFEKLFTRLGALGVQRGELQAAWQFHTASDQSMRGELLAMRSDVLERLGASGIGCQVTAVEEGYAGEDGGDGGPASLRRIEGTFTVPSYVDSPTPPARLVRDEAGIPRYTRDIEVPFVAIVPRSLAGTGSRGGPQGRLIAHGHGLMSTGKSTISRAPFRALAESLQAVIIATDWAGMSTPDAGAVLAALSDISQFDAVGDRLEQGVINFIALLRTFKGVCAAIPELSDEGTPLIDPTEVYFSGGSQGGILGPAVLSLSPDVERGVLFVGGASFPFMMDRSVDFSPYEPLMASAYPQRNDRLMILAVAQLLWDRTEATAHLRPLRDGSGELLPKTFLSLVAKNDVQVPNLASDYAMRSIDVPVIAGSAREPWGFDIAQAPFDGSGYITIDMGDRPAPDDNIAPDWNDQGHSRIAVPGSTAAILDRFLRKDGVITMPCDGVCDPD